MIVGLLFVGHGLQKLLGKFGGAGPEETGEFFEKVGLEPGRPHALAAGAAETAGGTLLALGFLTPLSAALLSGTMATAIRTVHAANGPWVTDGGYEYNLVLIALLFEITDTGPGAWSVDRALGLPLSGTGWALAELGTALAATALLTRGAETEAQEAGG
jgi:putative oxidoreductase